jgi:hypothetical protein
MIVYPLATIRLEPKMEAPSNIVPNLTELGATNVSLLSSLA